VHPSSKCKNHKRGRKTIEGLLKSSESAERSPVDAANRYNAHTQNTPPVGVKSMPLPVLIECYVERHWKRNPPMSEYISKEEKEEPA